MEVIAARSIIVFGFDIEPLNVNTSGRVWEISEDGNTLIQPLTSIKGLGDAAMDQIIKYRPFENVGEFLFHEKMTYSKLNKKALDVLCRSGALDNLIDDRFTGRKHFWAAIAKERPRKEKNLDENIEMYAEMGDFSKEEVIHYLADLTGVFPVSLVVNDAVRKKLSALQDNGQAPDISDYDPEEPLHHNGRGQAVVWFIPRKVTVKKTKKGKAYYDILVTDSNSGNEHIKCWGVDPARDTVQVNRPYLAALDYSPDWGFSTRAMYATFRILG